jgi:hypothetical protein
MRRLLVIAAMAAIPAVALAGCGGSGAGSSAGSSSQKQGTTHPSGGVITPAGARQVLAQFTSTNNQANKLRQASVLASYEGGSSYQIDAASYRQSLILDKKNKDYAPVTYSDPVVYVPRQTSYPAWFVVRTLTEGPKITSPPYTYLLFTRASASAKWIEVLEPATSGLPKQTPPTVATDAAGYATQVSPADATGLPLAPSALPAKQVTYLDVGNIPTKPLRPGLPTPKRPKVVTFANGNTGLGDLHDKAFWHSRLPSGSTQLDQHQVTTDPVYALRTTDGGALVFYDITAALTLAAPDATPFTMTIAGIFDGKDSMRAAQVNYDDQFVVYEAAGASAAPTVIANYSGAVSGECDGGPCKS